MAFGVTGDLGGSLTNLKLISSSTTPVAQSVADALDINGDIAASAYYGNSDGDLSETTSEYLLESGELDLSDLKLGEISTGLVRTSISLTTDNSESSHPKLTIVTQNGASAITAPDGALNTFTLPEITIKANSFAQPLGFEVDAGELQSCSLEFSCRYGIDTNGAGEPAAFGLAGAEGTVTAEFVNTGDSPAWTLEAGFTQVQAPTSEGPQAAWGTSSASARTVLARDVTAP
jgi:hypothetical protein